MSEEMEENHEAPSMASADGLICEIVVDPNGVSRDRLSIYSSSLIHMSFFVSCSGVSVWENSYPSSQTKLQWKRRSKTLQMNTSREEHGNKCDAGATILAVILMKGAEVKPPWPISRKVRYGVTSL